MKIFLVAFALALSVASVSAQVGSAKSAPSAASGVERGEVRRIDRAQGKVTLQHGELKSVDMPAMTMAFRVRDPVLLASLKVGDKVRFTVARQPDGALVVTDIAPAP